MDHKAVTGQLAKILGRDSKDITALIDGLATTMRDNLCDMNTVALPGFGEFIPEKEDEHIQNDLSTGQQILIPPSINIKFSPSAILKRKFNDRQ